MAALEEATGEERREGGNAARVGREGEGGGLTIGCKSLDKRPRIVKTRRDRDSILISCLVSGIDTQRR